MNNQIKHVKGKNSNKVMTCQVPSLTLISLISGKWFT